MSLDLSVLQLGEFSPLLFEFQDLIILRLDYNGITSIPDLSAPNHTLQELSLSKNHLIHVPLSISKLHLKIIDLSFNKISSFPYHLLQSPELRLIIFYGNPCMLSSEEIQQIKQDYQIIIRQ